MAAVYAVLASAGTFPGDVPTTTLAFKVFAAVTASLRGRLSHKLMPVQNALPGVPRAWFAATIWGILTVGEIISAESAFKTVKYAVFTNARDVAVTLFRETE